MLEIISFVFFYTTNWVTQIKTASHTLEKPKQSSKWFFSKTVFLPSISWLSTKGAGPHILTVPSSEALAIMAGTCGFQLTQFTVRVCPVSSAMGSSLRLCQMYTLWSEPNTWKAAWAALLCTDPPVGPTAFSHLFSLKPMPKTWVSSVERH